MSYSGGTYRGIQLASEFDKRGCLDKLFIPFYSQKHPYLTRLFDRIEDRQLVYTKKVKTNLRLCLYRKFIFKTCEIANAPRLKYRYKMGVMIDRWVSKHLDVNNSDMIIAESHQALYTIRMARKLGMITFLDRTNSHIKIQEKIDSAELEKHGMRTWHYNKDIEMGLKEYEETDYIIVPSTFVKRGFIAEGINEKKILCISPGIDLSNFKPIPKNDKVFRIIYVGGIHLRKGIQYLLEAISSLKLKDFELWLIGNVHNSMKGILKKYTGLYRLINFVPNYDLYKYYSQGSIFAFPSLEDSFGKVIVEAMSCGLPVIVTTNTAAEDVVRESIDGFIIPTKNVEALKEKILYMYENQKILNEMGQHAKKRANEEFSLEAYADRMIETFETILHKTRKNGDDSSQQ